MQRGHPAPHTHKPNRAGLASWTGRATAIPCTLQHPGPPLQKAPCPAPLPPILTLYRPRLRQGAGHNRCGSPESLWGPPRDQPQSMGTQGLILRNFPNLMGCPTPQPSSLPSPSFEPQAWMGWAEQVGRGQAAPNPQQTLLVPPSLSPHCPSQRPDQTTGGIELQAKL